MSYTPHAACHRRRNAVANTRQRPRLGASPIRIACRKCEAGANRAPRSPATRGESLRLAAQRFVSPRAGAIGLRSDSGLPTLRLAAMHVFPFADRLACRRKAPRARAPEGVTTTPPGAAPSAGASCGTRARMALGACALALLAGCATAPPGPPDAAVPDALRGATTEQWQETLHAGGDEVYRCRKVAALDTDAPGQAAGHALRWRAYGPEATLVDARGHNVGAIAPGRYFLAYDGSFAVARTETAAIVDTSALPWARYQVHASTNARDGSGGRMTHLSSVLRINTRGGLPASDRCALEGATLYVPYFATYLLYRRATLAQ
ncbi:DUF3455 domain-containing protein [Burkholderia glumae]|uniref:DUF3455 domain-containing protein n=3 Tax=Burkholderia glumae TaxID=337 RepID=UPI0021503E21|nr:DUF3455 domain-containing protein [Burkholderia glumae]